jgi:DNA-binding winged helix-turn-helix (wHTH) protein/dienelactone hydrolase
VSLLPHIFRFGVFELDPSAKELRKQGMRVRLQGQPVEILTMLLERPGELITREELQKKLWPSDTFVDFEQGLNSAMKRLRAALDDDAESPHFIETLPRHGYRFIGSVNGTKQTRAAEAKATGSAGALISRTYAVTATLLIVFLAAAVVWLYQRSEKRRWAREEAIPAITKLESEDKSLAAFLLLKEAEQYLPGDPQLTKIAEEDTRIVSITSSPPGATVEIQDYLSPDSSWFLLGTTPLKNIRIPSGYFRWKVTKLGVGEYVAAPMTDREMDFPLDSELGAPQGMSWVAGDPSWSEVIDFLGEMGPYNLPPYYIDRFEVTNRQYQEFVDQGGYKRRELWKQKFIRNGRELNWDEAMFFFRDRSGRPGPSTWEGGHYPEGQADYPVAGVSWYEASAYAVFVGKTLPVLFQWFKAALPEGATYTVRASNISRSALAPAGAFRGLGPYGTYDMAGNVREWVENATSDNLHFILGGAWNSQTYLYLNPEALPDFDRSPGNGFRCVRNTASLSSKTIGPIRTMQRDFAKVKPASDEVFRAYRAMYSYEDTPLHAKVEGVVADSADWRKEKITFNTAYDNERMAAYLFLPKKVQPPFQTVVFFPSARVLDLSDSATLGDTKFFDYIVQSGRAVLYPIYKGTYERQTGLVLPSASASLEYFGMSFKDLARSVDYLGTRPDIDKGKLAYLGVSMGAAEGVIYTALLQDKLKAVVLLDGGFYLGPPPPGEDQADFAPRLKRPVLMVNGKYDFVFSLERAQNPLFRMLGSPDADKRHIVLDSPHDVTERRTELVQGVLAWLDRYLGRVE